MVDSRPIGVFDSGVGGLTVLRAIHDTLPDESTIYLGDLGYFPYGPKPREAVRDRAVKIASHLLARDVKALVVACNTATSAAIDLINELSSCPVVGVVMPGAIAAVKASSSQVVGVIATQGTVRSGAYTSAILALSPRAKVVEVASGSLVGLIESGALGSVEIAESVNTAVAKLLDDGCDTIILGCTHFPLAKKEFERVAGAGVTILDSAYATASSLASVLGHRSLLSHSNHAPVHDFLVTGRADIFVDQAQNLFGRHVTAHLVDLDSDSLLHEPELAGLR